MKALIEPALQKSYLLKSTRRSLNRELGVRLPESNQSVISRISRTRLPDIHRDKEAYPDTGRGLRLSLVGRLR